MEEEDDFDLYQSLRDSVTGLVSALGGIDYSNPSRPYVLGDDALGCLKDLKKWIKFFGSSGKLDALRCIAETNLVSLDICEILGSFKQGQEDDKFKFRLALNCLELLVQLTWKIEHDPKQADQTQVQYEAPCEAAQIQYKNAILHNSKHNILRPIVRIALPSMAIPRRDRPERDDNIIILAISLLRNLVEISGKAAAATGADRERDVHSRSQMILSFEKSDVFNLLAALAARTTDEFEKVDCVLIELLYHLLKGVNAEDVISTPDQQTSKPLGDLSNMLKKEDNLKRYNKRNSSTRHNRFGTMISVVRTNDLRLTIPGQNALVNGQSGSLEKLDSLKKYVLSVHWNVESNDLDKPVHLTKEANTVLSSFVAGFLESSFNPLVASVTRAIEREAQRCLDVHRTHLLYIIGWFLKAHQLLHSKKHDAGDYGNIAAVFDPRCLVLVLRVMRSAMTDRNHTQLHAAMECFAELLSTVHAMSQGTSEEYQDIANNILLNLFYDEANLDMVVLCVKEYHKQSFGYLDACTSLAHIVLKVLEHFSEDQRMYIKSKRQRKADKNRQQGGESDSEDERQTKRVSEKAFQFTAFESKFMNDKCVSTFRSLLDYYEELRPDQIKRVLTFFHRLFVKRKQHVILYRLDICELLSRMVNDEINIPRDAPIRKHLEEFVKHYSRCLTKALAKTPALYVELLFHKIPNQLYYLQHGEEYVAPAKAPRAAAELEVKPGRSIEEQISIVVAALLDNQKSEALDSLKTIIQSTITELKTWDQEAEARRLAAEEQGKEFEKPMRQPVFLLFGKDGFRMTLFKDGKLQLLLRLMGAERLGDRDDPEVSWLIPGYVSTEDVENNLRFLKRYIDEPPIFEDDESPSKLIRPRKVVRNDYSDHDSNVSSDGADSFDSNLDDPDDSDRPRRRIQRRSKKSKPKSKKRKRREMDDEELQAAREKKRLAELEKQAKIKSAAKIVDSDDDEDEEREFFERERELREKMARMAEEGELPNSGTKKKKPKAPSQSRKVIPQKEWTVSPLADPDSLDEETMSDEVGMHLDLKRKLSGYDTEHSDLDEDGERSDQEEIDRDVERLRSLTDVRMAKRRAEVNGNDDSVKSQLVKKRRIISINSDEDEV